ncbi:MAG: bifunctional oligoribonuclease/PAP phosphatase NrnA [Rikenellaceae bacterium]
MFENAIEKINSCAEQLRQLFSESDNIVILSHINPDGDSIGSSLALLSYLTTLGKNVNAIVPNEIPAYLKSVAGVEAIHEYNKESVEMNKVIEEASLFVCLDFNEIDTRIGYVAERVRLNETAKKVLVDHHILDDSSEFEVVISDVNSCATSYLMTNILVTLGGEEAISELAAEALYLGIMTDTGKFSYGNLSGDLFRAVALLVDRGAKPVDINNNILNVQTLTRTRLVGYSLYKKMQIVKHHRMAYITLSENELMNFNYRPGDIEGIVNMPLAIKGIELSAIFIENKECIKISLRSQGAVAVDVNKLAREHFSGGGHKMAAGAKSFTTMKEAVDIFLKAVTKIYQ